MAVYNQVLMDTDPLYLQTKSYDARADRKWFADIASPGPVAAGDFNVTVNAGTMVLAIAPGKAWLLGGNVTDQGMYRQYQAVAKNVTVPNGSGAAPRIDTVIMRVMDNTIDASGFNETRVEVVPGTPTGGATLANLSRN